MVILIRTHRDLDGMGCAILARRAFGNDIKIEYCNYDDIDSVVMQDIKDIGSWDAMYITDISVNEETAKVIDSLPAGKVLLFDHHPTTDHLVGRKWATIRTARANTDIDKPSGTSIFYEYLLLNDKIEDSDILDQFVENVRQYDTWEWATHFNNAPIPKRLANLLTILGMRRFVERFTSDPDVIFTKEESMLLNIDETKRERYIKEALKRVYFKTLTVDEGDLKCGVIFAELNTSELAHAFLEERPDIDVAIVVNMYYRTVSFRTNTNSIHLGKIAERHFGGGGHPAAAGCELKEGDFDSIIRMLFNGRVN